MKSKKKITTIAILLIIQLVFALFIKNTDYVFAGTVSSYAVNESDYKSGATVTDTLNFTTATTATLVKISFLYSTTSAGTTVPAHLNLSSTTLGTLSGLGTGWTIDLSAIASGIVSLNNAGDTINASTAVGVPLQSVIHPQVGDCTSLATYSDTCYVHVTTYSAGNTVVDTGVAGYYLEGDPSLTFTVASVGSGTLTNGITTNVASTYDTIPFGHVLALNTTYAAQKLTVSTNAPSGYTVYMQMKTQMQGTISADYVDPFTGSSATWASPQLWSLPAGTTHGISTAWIGANTSDTRVTNWSLASAKFGPVDSTAHPVMSSTTADTGTSAYVTYAFAANEFATPDTYAGIIEYSLVPTY